MLDRKKTLDLMLSEVYGYVDTDGISVEVTCISEKTQKIYAGKARFHKTLEFSFTKGSLTRSFPVDLFIPSATNDYPLVVDLDFPLRQPR